MATLVFFDKGHQYELDGEKLPSVSEIIRFISREIYNTVSQFNMDKAADRGTQVHKITEALDKYGEAEVPEDILGYVTAYVKFSKEHDVHWDKIEYSTHHPDNTYAGTLDRVGKIDGYKTIVDMKTSSVIHKPLVTAQLTLYDMMVPEEQIEKLFVLQLKNDGTYKLEELQADYELANACLTLHSRLKKKPRTRNKKNKGE